MAKKLRPPDMLGIGVMKGGTSWTWKQLKKHPEIGVPRKRGRSVKEMHYIDRLHMTLHDYLKRFGKVDPKQKTGEITPNYIATPYAPALVKTWFPEVKLFCIFRNPADRAFSHYKDHLYYRRIPGNITFLEAFHQDYPQIGLKHFSIKNKGMYGDQLELWYRYFDKEQLKVMFYDDLVADPAKFIQDIYEYVGVDRNFLPADYQERHVKRYNKVYDSMKFESVDREEVTKFYAEQVKKLQDLTGRKLNWS